MKVDVENFYTSILIDLFTDAISYAKTITNVDDDQLSVIMQSRKALLFDNNEPWFKQTGEENFDVPMSCYDGAEVCELVGTYILNKCYIQREHWAMSRQWIGNISPKTEIERQKTQIVKVFKSCGLSITITINLVINHYILLNIPTNHEIY